MTGLVSVGFFLTQVVFNLMLFVLWIRVFSRFFHVSSLHPINQTLNTLLRPVLGPLDSQFYTRFKANSRYDTLSFACILLVDIVKISILGLLALHTLLPLPWFMVLIISDLLLQPLNLLFYMTLIRVLMHFINPGWHSPIADIIKQFTTPLLTWFKQRIPLVSGFDISPWLVLLGIKVLTVFITASLPLPLL